MQLKNMQMSEAEAKADYGLAPTSLNDLPKYPWGLTLSLDDASLKKLEMGALPEVGTKLVLMAEVEVTAVRSNQERDGDKRQSVDLQITDMSLSPSIEKESAASVIYPGEKA